MNPLWYGEVPDELIASLRQKCALLVGDAQGFVRHIRPDGSMYTKDWARKAQLLKHFDLFKIDNKEARVLCGTEDLFVAAKMLVELGAKASACLLLPVCVRVCVC